MVRTRSLLSLSSALFCGAVLLAQATTVAEGLRFGGIGIGASGGYVDPGPAEPTVLIGGHALLEWELGEFGQVQYRPYADFWTRDVEESSTVTATWRHLAVAPVELSYHLPVRKGFPLQAYVGAGIGASVTIYSYDTNASGSKDPEVNTSTNLFGGVELKVLKVLIPFIELRLTAGGVSGVKLTVGVTLRTVRPVEETPPQDGILPY